MLARSICMEMVRRVCGIFVFTVGLALAVWVAFNLLIELQPEAEGGSPRGAILLSVLFLWVGARWIRGHQAG
jgi:hypothetical protein